jgi:outer membrane protein W
MKKIVLMASLLFAGYSANAQGFYAELNFGYGFGNPSGNLGTEKYVDLAGDGSYDKPIYGTMGSGLNLTLTPGYMITKHLGVELGINYFLGAKTVVSNTTTSMDNIYDKTTANSNQLRIIPSLVVSTGGDKLFAYAKGGLILPVIGSTTGVREASTIAGTTVVATDVTTTTKGAVSLGFRGSVGIGYNITELIGLNLEVFHSSLTIKSKSRTIDTYTVAGQDQLVNAPAYATEVNYVDELNSSSNNADYNANFSTTSAKDELAPKTNFNQFGVALGIRFSF